MIASVAVGTERVTWTSAAEYSHNIGYSGHRFGLERTMNRLLFPLISTLLTVLLVGCGAGTESSEESASDVPEKCRNVHVDKLAADWLAVRGNVADPKTRIRIEKGGADGTDYRGMYVGGFFTKVEMKGEKRDDDVRFTEIPTAKKAARVKAGEAQLTRIYAKPRLSKCAIEVFAGKVDAAGKETIPPKGVEFVLFPSQDGVTFTYEPAQRTLFLADAAKDKTVADKQVQEAGGASPEAEFPNVPVGMWSNVEEDGDPACTYDMDLYFDDRNVPELTAVSAGEVKDGFRHWFQEWEAPYSGNHHFEMYRYRTCEGEARELIDIAAIEAVLM